MAKNNTADVVLTKNSDVKIKGDFVRPKLLQDMQERELVAPADVRKYCKDNKLRRYWPLRNDSARSSAHTRGWREFIWKGKEIILYDHVLMVQPEEYVRMREEARHKSNTALEEGHWASAVNEVASASGGRAVGAAAPEVKQEDLEKDLDF